jgi:2-methylcitrate dehydratase PrpD
LKIVKAAYVNFASKVLDYDDMHWMTKVLAPALTVPEVIARVDMKSFCARSLKI